MEESDASFKDEEDEESILSDEVVEDGLVHEEITELSQVEIDGEEARNEYCESDGSNCGVERGENIYAFGEESKSKQTSDEKSTDRTEHKVKTKSTPSPENLEDELKASYKSTQKKTKRTTSSLVNLEGCQNLLEQAQVRTKQIHSSYFSLKALDKQSAKSHRSSHLSSKPDITEKLGALQRFMERMTKVCNIILIFSQHCFSR